MLGREPIRSLKSYSLCPIARSTRIRSGSAISSCFPSRETSQPVDGLDKWETRTKAGSTSVERSEAQTKGKNAVVEVED